MSGDVPNVKVKKSKDVDLYSAFHALGTPNAHVTETDPSDRYLGHRQACKHSPGSDPITGTGSASQLVGLHLRNPSLMDYYSFNRLTALTPGSKRYVWDRIHTFNLFIPGNESPGATNVVVVVVVHLLLLLVSQPIVMKLFTRINDMTIFCISSPLRNFDLSPN